MFITLEGPEGAGKTTLIESLANLLKDGGREVVVTREPGEGPVGRDIRQILLHGHILEPLTEVFLFLADRTQHVATMIRPALERGATVLCDRYGDSTVVYQGYARGLDVLALRSWNDEATGSLKPDLTLLLDLDPTVGLSRLKTRDRLDAEPLSFHQRVREGFLAEASLEPNRWHILDASLQPSAVLAAAVARINSHL